MNLVKYLIIVSVAFVLNSCGDPCKRLYGSWKIYKYANSPICALTDEEASAFIGIEFIFSKTNLIINGVKLGKPSYKFSKQKADNYFYHSYRMPKEYIGINEGLIEIVTISNVHPKSVPHDFFEHKKANLAFCIDELILYHDELIFQLDGIFFYLKKQKRV